MWLAPTISMRMLQVYRDGMSKDERAAHRKYAENSYAMGQGVHWDYTHNVRKLSVSEGNGNGDNDMHNGSGGGGGGGSSSGSVTTEPVAIIDSLSNEPTVLLISEDNSYNI